MRKIYNIKEFTDYSKYDVNILIAYLNYLAEEWDKKQWDFNDFVVNFSTRKQAEKYYGKYWRFICEYLDQIDKEKPLTGREMMRKQINEIVAETVKRK